MILNSEHWACISSHQQKHPTHKPRFASSFMLSLLISLNTWWILCCDWQSVKVQSLRINKLSVRYFFLLIVNFVYVERRKIQPPCTVNIITITGDFVTLRHLIDLHFDLIALFFLSFFPERALTVKRYCSFAQQHFTGS